MEFVRRGFPAKDRIALFPGAWNPPTVAHMALGEASLAEAEECVFVIPRSFPHKEMTGPDLECRIKWLCRICAERPGLSVAIADGGLFIEIAREARAATGCSRISLVCGADAADRIVHWNYGPGDSIERQLNEYNLLVAPRGAHFEPPPNLAGYVRPLQMPDEWHDVSSTEIRQRIAESKEWERLVPPDLIASVRAAYVS